MEKRSDVMTGNGTVQPCSVLKRKRREQSGIGKAEWGPVMEKWSKAENRNGIVAVKN